MKKFYFLPFLILFSSGLLVAHRTVAFVIVTEPMVSFVESTLVVEENVGTISIELGIENANTQDTEVQVAVATGATALEGVDYTLTTRAVTFTPGGVATQSLSLNVLPNADLSGKYLALEIATVTNGVIGSNAEILILIKDVDDAAPPASANPVVQLTHLGSAPVAGGGEAKAEISAYDPASQRLFVTNADQNTIEILDFSDPANLSAISSVDLNVHGSGGVNSVAVGDGVIAVAVQAAVKTDDGQVLFFDTDGAFLNAVTVGALPDMVVFTPDGSKVLTANEGEPDDAYQVDPLGGISIIDVSGGIDQLSAANVTTLDFTAFDAQEALLKASGVRIFGPGAGLSQDLEPEYIALSDDGAFAFATCQENNAVAVIDVTNAAILTILPIGYKDWTALGLTLDASNRSSDIFFANWPIKGMYQPDAIDFFSVGGQSYLITANEGDARDYDGFSEEARVGDADYVLDPTAFPDAELLKKDELLGRLLTTSATGDTDGDGDFDEIYSYGARSFSIWNAATGALVYDSGNDLELITAADPVFGPIFNSTDDENGFKNRSDDKGPEPEAVVVGEINSVPYAFIGLERIGGVMMYDVRDPAAPVFIQWINTRDPNMDAGDLAPEGLVFIPSEDSPTGQALLAVTYEVSGTVAVFAIETPATLSFAGEDALVEENAGTITVDLIVESPGALPGALNVSVVEASTAVDGEDYTIATAGLEIPAGSSETVSLSLEILDNDVEGGRYLILQIDGSSTVGIGSQAEFLLMIKDNDHTVPMAPTDAQVTLRHLGSLKSGAGGSARAEILAHDPVSQRIFVTNGADDRLEIIGLDESAALDSISSIDLSPYGAAPNSVAVHGGVVAVAIQGASTDDPGVVALFDADGNFINQVTVGVLPDMLLFSPDGTKILTANEGEPSGDYTIDPEGSVSVIDLSKGATNLTQADVITITFEGFNDDADMLRAMGVRIFGPGATVAQDLEPEYITISADGATAYVNCQENNALVLIDLATNTPLAILPIGYKDWTEEGVTLDASNRSDDIFFANWPIKGMYQPDAIHYFEVDGQGYLITANEGDARDYDAFSEEFRIGDDEIVLDETAFPDAAYLKNSKLLGRLRITSANGDTDGDGDYDELYAYGGRSFSIWDATTGALIYDSGNELEQITANDPLFGQIFNSDDEENAFKNRSDDKGPEPEAVRVGTIGSIPYAFIGLERIGGIMMYEVSDPTDPTFVQYINTRSVDAEGEGDISLEGLIFIPAAESPNGRNLVAASYEVSGTVAIFEANFSCELNIAVDTVICMNEPFVFDPGDGFKVSFDGATDTIFTAGPLMPGDYTYDVIITGPDGCSQEVSLKLTSDNCTNIKEVYADHQIRLFPNPSEGRVELSFSDLEQEEHLLEVFNITGRSMFGKSFEPLQGVHSERLDLDRLPAGVYVVKITSANKTWSRQLILE